MVKDRKGGMKNRAYPYTLGAYIVGMVDVKIGHE